MNQNDYISNINYTKPNYYSKENQITENNNMPLSNLIKLEQDIFFLINYIRKNPLEFCNNLMQKTKHKTNPEQNDVINYLQEIHSTKVLKPFIKIPELGLAARSLLNEIQFHYKKNHSLNLKELEPNKKNLRLRLSKFGERTGKIFETVLFELDNSEDIINHILIEAKGRKALLSNEMTFIGIACDIIDTNLICTVIEIVQDFNPYKDTNNINNNIYMIYNNNDNNNNNNNYNFNKSNFGKYKQNNYYYNQKNYQNNNTEYISLIQNLTTKNNKDNLKLKLFPEKKANDLSNNININDNNISNNNIHINMNEGKNIYYKTPKKFKFIEYKKNSEIYSLQNGDQSKNNIKKAIPKRMNSNNINLLKIDLNKNEKDVDINNIKFTMAGRTNLQQQEIIEISKKNLNKSKSVCSFDIVTVNSKNVSKNKFQKLNHEEKMQILHKINNRNIKTPNLMSSNSKNSDNNAIPLPLKIENNDNNQEYFDINSETEKYNLYDNNYYYNNYAGRMTKNLENNNYNNTNIQTLGDKKNNNNTHELDIKEQYSKNKLIEIKNDIKAQLKEELKNEVREEIRNEFNKHLLFEKNQKIENGANTNNKIEYNLYSLPNNQKIELNNIEIKTNQNKINNNNNKIYSNKNKCKNKWSSVEKYYYIKNDKNNFNNNKQINNNLYFPNNKNINNISNKKIYYKGRKSFDWRDFISNNKQNDGFVLKQKYQERYTKSNYPDNNINNNYNINEDYIETQIREDLINKYKNRNLINGDKSENNSYFNQIYRPKTKKEIKQLIRIYNMAKDDKKNKNMDNSSSYNIINNNKSINNYIFNKSNGYELNSDVIINNNIEKNGSKLIIEDYYEDNTNKTNSTTSNGITNIVRKNSHKKIENNENINKNFVEGHRFQIKYEKVKSKSQIYKNDIPKKRNFSMNKINPNIATNVINDVNNLGFISENKSPTNIDFNKNEDMVNLDNSKSTNNQNNIFNERIEKSLDKKINNTQIMQKGGYEDFNNITEINFNNIGEDIRNYMDENMIYKESNEKPKISKTEKLEGNSVVTTIITQTKKVYTPDKEKVQKNNDNTDKKNITKKQIQYKNNINMTTINDNENNNKEIKNLTDKKNNNGIKTKNISLKKITSDMNSICRTPIQKKINENNNYFQNYSLYSGNSSDTENLEKKYIKDPEGNLIETYVKKTKYKDGSILLEYV